MSIKLITLAVIVSLGACSPPARAQVSNPLLESRYCGEPKRDLDGRIIRSPSVLRAFKKAHPCPVTGLSTGACPGWSMDHVIPLACGGCDAVYNLQWLPDSLKSVAVTGKDRFERLIYCIPMQIVK